MHVHRPGACGDDFDAVGELVAVEVDEHATMGDVVGRDPAPEIAVVVVAEGRVAGCAV